MSYLPTYTVNVQNWSPRHRGVIVGVLQIPYQIGPVLISIIYNSFFVKGHEKDVMLQDLQGFFVTVCVLLGSFTIIAFLFTKVYPHTESDSDREHMSLVDNDVIQINQDGVQDTGSKHTSIVSGVKDLDVHLIFWAQAITPVAGFTMLTNITSMLQSLGHINLSFAYTTSGPVVALLVKMAASYISDKFIHKISRVSISMICSIFSTLILLIAVGFGNHLSILSLAYFISISSAETTFCMLPTALSEQFVNDLFGYVFTSACLIACVANAIEQPIAGYLYDRETDGANCFGPQCFQNVFILVGCIQLVGTLLHSLIVFHTNLKHKSKV